MNKTNELKNLADGEDEVVQQTPGWIYGLSAGGGAVVLSAAVYATYKAVKHKGESYSDDESSGTGVKKKKDEVIV